jgi:hypothetical protein
MILILGLARPLFFAAFAADVYVGKVRETL